MAATPKLAAPPRNYSKDWFHESVLGKRLLFSAIGRHRRTSPLTRPRMSICSAGGCERNRWNRSGRAIRVLYEHRRLQLRPRATARKLARGARPGRHRLVTAAASRQMSCRAAQPLRPGAGVGQVSFVRAHELTARCCKLLASPRGKAPKQWREKILHCRIFDDHVRRWSAVACAHGVLPNAPSNAYSLLEANPGLAPLHGRLQLRHPYRSTQHCGRRQQHER